MLIIVVSEVYRRGLILCHCYCSTVSGLFRSRSSAFICDCVLDCDVIAVDVLCGLRYRIVPDRHIVDRQLVLLCFFIVRKAILANRQICLIRCQGAVLGQVLRNCAVAFSFRYGNRKLQRSVCLFCCHVAFDCLCQLEFSNSLFFNCI